MAPSGANRLSGANANDTRSMTLPNAMQTRPPTQSGCRNTLTGACLPSGDGVGFAFRAAAACSVFVWQSFCMFTPVLDSVQPPKLSKTPTTHAGKPIVPCKKQSRKNVIQKPWGCHNSRLLPFVRATWKNCTAGGSKSLEMLLGAKYPDVSFPGRGVPQLRSSTHRVLGCVCPAVRFRAFPTPAVLRCVSTMMYCIVIASSLDVLPPHWLLLVMEAFFTLIRLCLPRPFPAPFLSCSTTEQSAQSLLPASSSSF